MTVVRGLPERLPADERLLWQGAPAWRVLARRGFHVRKLAIYFALLVAWVTVTGFNAGEPAVTVLLSVLKAAGLGAIPVALVLLYALAVGRSTLYTITDRRVVLRGGLVLPLSINLPFSRIADANLVARPDGSGDIALALSGSTRLAYLVLWPSVRPWRFSRAEPMLRALTDVQPVAQILARALAASAGHAAPVLVDPTQPNTIPHAVAA